MAKKQAIYVEICQKSESFLNAEIIEEGVTRYLKNQNQIIPDDVITGVLPEHLNYFRTCLNSDVKCCIKLDDKNIDLRFCIYQNSFDVPQFDTIDGEQEDGPMAYINWPLPNKEFEGLWESLVFYNNIKIQLLEYVQTALLYSQKQVSSQIVKWNNVVLLHGPPGTGKTSLCKALAHKLSIRLSKQYKSGQLVEINTHSLFSKWFSESAKLVFQMFNKVKQWLEYKDNFVCILIDEVESLTHARDKTGMEPTDSIRVVNAVLTQLDHLQRYQNFLVLATSNLTNAIDIAFADRADLKLFIDYPGQWASYDILKSCIDELIRCQLIEGGSNEIFKGNILKHMKETMNCGQTMNNVQTNSNLLLDLARLCSGLSGRTLRKIPFLTSTKFVDSPSPRVEDFLIVMREIVIAHKQENEKYFSEKASVANGVA